MECGCALLCGGASAGRRLQSWMRSAGGPAAASTQATPPPHTPTHVSRLSGSVSVGSEQLMKSPPQPRDPMTTGSPAASVPLPMMLKEGEKTSLHTVVVRKPAVAAVYL